MSEINKHGPHGGVWMKTDHGHIEISVFETNVPPRFRLYFYDSKRQPVSLPSSSDVKLNTIRPEGKKQDFVFNVRHDYLEAIDELPEPHKFKVTLSLGHGNSTRHYHIDFTEEGHSHSHGGHGHSHDYGTGMLGKLRGIFGHSHHIADKIDESMESNERGIKTLKTTLLILGVTATIQLAIVLMSGSVALLADTIHNFADATTSIPLWFAFALARRGTNRKFTYGYGKVEDIAGIIIVLIIFFSACVAAYESVRKILHPMPIHNLVWVSVAAIVGFLGNEWVAKYRISVGNSIGSAALVADGYHARVDGFTSLAVLLGVLGVWIGLPIIDPIVGCLITIAILFIVKDAVKSVGLRLIDGIEPDILEEIEHAPTHVEGVIRVHDVRARWIGHRVHAEVVIDVDPNLSVRQADQLAKKVVRALRDHVRLLGSAMVKVRPTEEK